MSWEAARGDTVTSDASIALLSENVDERSWQSHASDHMHTMADEALEPHL